MIYTSLSEKETSDIAVKLAANLAIPQILCLYGTLGMGKSVFARSLIRSLCGDFALEVPSPTFTLVQQYDGISGPIYHFDLYRTGAPEEIYELGWDEALHDGFTIVEWPERLENLLPKVRSDIVIETGDQGPESRIIKVEEKT